MCNGSCVTTRDQDLRLSNNLQAANQVRMERSFKKVRKAHDDV